MRYQVVLESPDEAIVKTTYLNKSFNYVFLGITCEPTEGSSKKKNVVKKYTFLSSALLPPFPHGDPRRFKVIRQMFHGENDINVVVEATSLQEACDKFATPYNDVFEVMEAVVHPPFTPPPTAAQKRKARAAELS
ncbi:MAG: hypothetical protein Q8916_02715 [Bacteroidota bacterium]|nr:hypothetical protein [Bacteroidota bacterium]MDP4229300.1 hypothetical protein [Bacteroidota bacterium]MDP4234875.1 hypothetical protein [Bacteroidota bacterium]